MDKCVFRSENCLNIMDLLFEGVYVADRDRMIRYWNKGAEDMVGYTAEEVVGKQYCKNFLVHVDHKGEQLCNTACPVAATMADGKVVEAEVFVHHKSGHRVPVSIRTIPLMGPDNQVTGVVELFRDNSPRELLAKELLDMKGMAEQDGLTGLHNRRYAEIIIKAKLNELKDGGNSFGLLFIDIDHFKYVNDSYGHDTGDLVLRMIAKTLLNNTRQADAVIRWGGEEMVVLVADAGIKSKLMKIAEKLRILISKSFLPLEDGEELSVTVSIGATVATAEDTIDTLIRRGDKLMYTCKNEGRNCVRADI